MLFAKSQMFGSFKGFNERGLEFAAEIVAPYDASMLERPQLGQFLLIELGSLEEAALGRVTRFAPSGLLASPEGEDYVNTMQRRQQDVPENLKQARLKYRVQIKLLGAVRWNAAANRADYVPSQRRLPHLGARVALPSPEVLQRLCQLTTGTTVLGHYALGEFVYCGHNGAVAKSELRPTEPCLEVKFDINNLVSRRSVVFARAGYGKSNLMKYLLAELYREPPKTVTGSPVGTLLFDADGEYFWPDTVRGRPGLCDVPHLREHIHVFTNRKPPSPYYGAWKAGEVKLDIRELPPRDVIGIALPEDKQSQQNVLKLKALNTASWRQLVDKVFAEGLQVSDNDVGTLMGYNPAQIQNSLAEIGAARSNMFNIVRTLHDPASRLLGGALDSLRKGAVVVVDISLLSSAAGNMLSGLLLRRIFNHNQENFTGGSPVLPVIAVLEEAQSVLGRNLDESSPYVEWVKEGRKYNLGAILITQQPGSLAPELLSQADNWFCFHLLAEADAHTLGKFNAHYSTDVLAHLVGEPIVGNCYMWSAPHQPFVIPVRISDFEALYANYVQKGADAAPAIIPRDAAEKEARRASHNRLAEALRAALKGPSVRFFWVNQQSKLVGLKSGQLYFLIKDIRTVDDYESEEMLKRPLLEELIGAGAVLDGQAPDGKPAFVANLENWERALGTIRVS